MIVLDDLLAARLLASGRNWTELSAEERRAALLSEHEEPIDVSGACKTGKAKHATQIAAQHEIDNAALPKEVTPYICKHCRSWHVGNPRKANRRIKVRR